MSQVNYICIVYFIDAIANQAIENNKFEFWRASKDYVERTCSSLLKKIANRIAGSAPFDEILPAASDWDHLRCQKILNCDITNKINPGLRWFEVFTIWCKFVCNKHN